MDIYDELFLAKETIHMFKNNKRSLDDVLEMYGVINPSNEVKEAWKFAYENVENWEKVVLKYENNKVPIRIKKNQLETESINTPEIVQKAVVLIQLLTREADCNIKLLKVITDLYKIKNLDLGEFSQAKWTKIFQKIIYERCSSGIWSYNLKLTYEVITPLIEIDLFGQWEKDLLFGHIKLLLKTDDDKPFPKYWKIDGKKVNDLKIEYQKTYTDNKLKEKAKDDNKQETLESFLKQFLEKNQKTQYTSALMKVLGDCYVNSLNDLLTLPATAWASSLEKPLGTLYGKLKQEIDQYRKQKKSKFMQRTRAELLSDLHKVRRFLYYEAGNKEEFDKLGFLDAEALRDGFNEQKNDKKFDGGPVLESIQNSLEEFTKPPLEFSKASHGMILWGPPGTGKTKLCEIICRKAGIELSVEPLSSSELNRSKVGETEQLLMSLFARAERMPFLLCCIAIDEIDALTPKRNEKTGEHKVDVLCLLLSLIGGIKDVSNVYVIASTNRLNKIDEAFCRRLQTKFFVGRLPPQKRLDILLKIQEVKVKTRSNDNCINISSTLHKLIQQLTINFSGAAIESFRSRIVSYCQNHEAHTLSRDLLIKFSNQVAGDFQILLGSYSIPALISASNSAEISLNDTSKYTGRVIVDLSNDENCVIQLEYQSGKKKVVQENTIENIKLSHDIMPLILKMAIKKNIDFVQMFDTAMLLNNAAFDDNTIMETILEKKGEWEQYPTAMAIFDVDSLIGVNENVSDSSMGQSLSHSITNNKLWHQVVIQMANSKLENSSGEGHKWIVVITKSGFISSQFKALTSFPLSQAEKNQQDQDSKDRKCINCDIPFKNCKNGLDSCNYHDGPLVDMRVRNPRNFVNVDRNQLVNILMGSTDRQKDVQNYLYLCCLQGHQSSGCRKSYHSDTEDKRDHERYLN